MEFPDVVVANPSDTLKRLTPKERAVLDLVVQHRTTKEIARQLDVAPNTVDMRLRSARDKLRARDRNDTARIYGALLDACGKTTCDSAVMSRWPAMPLADSAETRSPSNYVLEDVAHFTLPAPWETAARTDLPEVLDERFGKWWRVAAIPLGALSIALLALALIAMATNLGMLI